MKRITQYDSGLCTIDKKMQLLKPDAVGEWKKNMDRMNQDVYSD